MAYELRPSFVRETNMDKKLAQRLQMSVDMGLVKLNKQAYANASRELDKYEEANGYGFGDEFDSDKYEHWTRTDEGFGRLFDVMSEQLDQLVASRKKLASSIEKFTDGQIEFRTAYELVINPRYADRLEAIVMGEAA